MTRKTKKRLAAESASGIVPNSGNCPPGQRSVATAKGIECIDETTAMAANKNLRDTGSGGALNRAAVGTL